MTSYPAIRLFFGGKWLQSRDHLPIVNPADESQVGLLPVACQGDLDNAVSAAQKGFRI